MNGKRLRVAVIGLGGIGSVHISVICEGENELVAICDIDKNKLNNYPDIKGYTDYKEMLDTEKLDVVHICTPHYLHAEMVIYALEHNISVLCEKPVCMKIEEIERVLEAEKRSMAQLGVCFQNRYNPSYIFAKIFLQGKKIEYAYAHVFWHRGKDYYPKDNWHGKKATEGGGVLINQAIHTLDALQWICGYPKSLLAITENISLKGLIEVEDTATVICKGDNDFILSATNSAFSDYPVEVVIGTSDEEIRFEQNYIYVNGERLGFENTAPLYSKKVYGTGHSALIYDFYDCVRQGRKFEIDGTEAAKALKLVLAAYESCGREIKL